MQYIISLQLDGKIIDLVLCGLQIIRYPTDINRTLARCADAAVDSSRKSAAQKELRITVQLSRYKFIFYRKKLLFPEQPFAYVKLVVCDFLCFFKTWRRLLLCLNHLV